jgi:hypothetical protein
MNKKFKIIAMGRVGTLAINRYLDNHPNISLPSFKESGRVFISPTENIADMLQSRAGSTEVKGVMIHGSEFLDKLHRKNLVKLNNIKTDCLIHLVRNPVEQAKGWINHINSSAEMGILGWEKIPATAQGFFERYPMHFDTIKAGLQCRRFYKGNKRIKLIDFPQLSKTKINGTMSSLYNFLGVGDYELGDMLQQPQNNYTREILGRGFSFQLNGEIVNVFMAPVSLFFHEDKNVKPWVTIHDTQKIYELCPTLPPMEGDLLFAPKSIQDFNQLSFKTRKMVSEGVSDILGEILPVWAKQAEDTAQKIEINKLKGFTEQDIDFIETKLKDDMRIFERYHPEIYAGWTRL